MRRVLLIDISDHVAGSIAQGLQDRGCMVYRPLSLIEFTSIVGIASHRGWTGDYAPDIILNVHSQDTVQITDTCEMAEMLGIRVMNPWRAVVLCADRRHLLHTLRRNDITVPDFFYGHPRQIPEEFGQEVVLKDLRGHLMMRVKVLAINSRDELIYCERVVPNSSRVIRTVYSICGKIFTVEKTDVLQVRRDRQRAIVMNDPWEAELAGKISTITGLDFFNFDLIGDTVIDVNAFPNFFPYLDAVDAMVEHIATMP